MAEAILTVPRARGLAVGEEAQARLHRIEDRDRLARWLALAVTAPTANMLFDE